MIDVTLEDLEQLRITCQLLHDHYHTLETQVLPQARGQLAELHAQLEQTRHDLEANEAVAAKVKATLDKLMPHLQADS